jgi:hypothetical protein
MKQGSFAEQNTSLTNMHSGKKSNFKSHWTVKLLCSYQACKLPFTRFYEILFVNISFIQVISAKFYFILKRKVLYFLCNNGSSFILMFQDFMVSRLFVEKHPTDAMFAMWAIKEETFQQGDQII